MTAEQFQQWRLAVIMQVESGKEETSKFADQVEQHDPQAAALLRQVGEATEALSAHLQQGLEDKG